MWNHWQCLQTKLDRHNDKSTLFGKFFVKLLATFTSKSRSTTFGRPVCLLPLVAFHSQSRFFPSLFPQATPNLKQKARTGTENEKKRSDKGIQSELDRANFVTSRPSLPRCSLYYQRELTESKATKHSFYKMIYQTRARNIIVTTFFPSPWTIGNFRASSSVTVFKALPTIQLIVTRLEVYIQPTEAMMSSLQRNDNAKRAMSANWVAVLSVIIVKNIIPELNTGCFYLIFELKACMATKTVLSPKSR